MVRRGERDARRAMRGAVAGASRPRRRLTIVVLASVLVAGCGGTAGRVEPGAPDDALVAARIQQVEQGLLPPVVVADRPMPAMTIEERMRALNVPGVSVAVVNGGRIEWAKGYGVMRAGTDRAVDTATLFQAASISKPVATLGALELVEQGKLALDEDVNARLTSWRVPAAAVAGAEKVTLRRLVSHNAGLTVHGFPGYARGVAVPTAVQVLDGAPPANTAAVRIDLVPGSRWRYSGGGFTVAQQLMSDVAGRPFASVMHDLVLQPLGMSSSTYEQPLPDAMASRAAHAHNSRGEPIPGDWHTYPEQAAAGLWTTPSDLARMILAVQGMAAGATGALLDPATAREMLSVQAGEYGLGFGLGGEGSGRFFSHGGSNAGFRAFFVGFVEGGRGAAIMTNGDLGSAVAMEILRGIANVYGWPAFAPEAKTMVAIAPERLTGLAGRYRPESSGAERTLAITVEGGVVRAQIPAWLSPRELFHAGDDRFFMSESALEVRFERDAAGRATAAILLGGGEPTRAVRIE